jgi:hypothetical protein
MTSLHRQDADLHHCDGSHRSTSPRANGRALAAHERRITAHLAEHQRNKPKDSD